MGSEETDAVVTPIIVQAPLEQVRVLDELVHRHQLDSRDPEVDQIANDGRMSQPCVSAAKFVGHVGVALSEALHVGLVDHGFVQGSARGLVALPVEGAARDNTTGHVRSRVHVVALLGVIEAVAKDSFVPLDFAFDRRSVGVE